MRKPAPTTFDGTKLRVLREAAGFSVDDLADQAGRHLRADVVDLYEAGKRHPSFERLAAIGAALEVDLDEMLDPNAATSAHHWHREAAGLSNAHVADKLGVHRSTVSRWDLTGEVSPQHLDACAKLYHTTPEALLSAVERISLSLSPTVAGEIDRRRGRQSREHYLTDLVTQLHSIDTRTS